MNTANNADALGSQKIGRLLLQYSVPAIIATSAASLYNIIDRIFIGQGVGPLAISGLALTFPLMNLAASFGALVGVGASTMVSIRLGERKKVEAVKLLSNALMLNLVLGVSFSIITLSFLDKILYMLGASPETLPYARDFMRVILSGNVFLHIYIGLNFIMRASGYPRKAMFVTLSTVASNLVLAPVFIFKFRWGIQGAALATVTSQFLGVILVLSHFLRKTSFVRFLPGYFKFEKKIIFDIFSIGMSNFLMLMVTSMIVVILNLSLKKYGGDFAIGAYGIINGIGNLIVMIVMGFTQGMQPIAGYNFGAKLFNRVMEVFRKTVIAGTCVTVSGFLINEIFASQLARAFTTDNGLIALAANGLRINLMMFPVIGFQIVTSNFFQSIGNAKISVVLGLSRQVLFLIPALLIVPRIWGLNGVWFASPIADLSASVTTFFVLRRQLKKLQLVRGN